MSCPYVNRCKDHLVGTHVKDAGGGPGGGGGYSTQSWVLTVKLIEKAVAVNPGGQSSSRRGGHISMALHLEVVYKIRWLQ